MKFDLIISLLPILPAAAQTTITGYAGPEPRELPSIQEAQTWLDHVQRTVGRESLQFLTLYTRSTDSELRTPFGAIKHPTEVTVPSKIIESSILSLQLVEYAA